MPVESTNQLKAMQAAAGGRSNLGIPKSVAKEFLRETTQSAFIKLGKLRRR